MTRFRTAITFVLSSALFACSSGSDPDGQRGALGGAPAPTHTEESALAENNTSVDLNDPCAANLDVIVTALMDYYSVHRSLPEVLDHLTVMGTTTQVPQVCPINGKPYQYFPDGFQLRREFLPPALADNPHYIPPMLILFDAQPVHEVIRQVSDGHQDYSLKSKMRYGILMEPPAPDRVVKMWIVPMDQALLDFYLKSPIRRQVRPD